VAYSLTEHMNDKLKNQIQKIPQSPGIYIFKDKKGRFLYIGKAANLRNRVRQYFKYKTVGVYLKFLIDEATKIKFKTTDSEIEALILESRLIKEHQPKYNIMLRDDKQYFYVVFTKEKFPKIFIKHNPEAREYIGPFTDGTALKTTLRLLRRILPYCTCKKPHNNFCLNYHIGKCPGICCIKNPESGIRNYELRFYRRNIKAIKDILSGKKNSVVQKLKKELNQSAEKQDFENAIKLRNQVEKLERTFANAKIIHNSYFVIRDSKSIEKEVAALKELAKIFKLSKVPYRIEGYDISNIQGKSAVGAMVVFTSGQPDKNEYRKFRIISKKTPDDTAMLKEILIRRFNHQEWPYPNLIFIDGGKGQLNAARAAISNFEFLISKQTQNSKFKIPVISLAKGKNEVFATTLNPPAGGPLPLKKLPNGVKNLILNIDAEAHRFAINYYRKLQRRAALPRYFLR